MHGNRSWGFGRSALVALLLLLGLSSRAEAQYRTTERTRLAASDGIGDNRFGTHLDVDGDVMIMGAYLDHGMGEEQGAAYVYRKVGRHWIEEQKLTASDAGNFDHFGHAVGISGDVAVVAAIGDDQVPGGGWVGYDGAAYVFRRQGGTWIEEQKIVPNDLEPEDKFGAAVSIEGDTLLVGASTEGALGPASGSAYVFRYSAGFWVQEVKLTASDGGTEDTFGARVSLQGGRALVGAPKTNSGLRKNGAAYVFEDTGSGWPETQKLEASDLCLDGFGSSVALDGDVVVVGAPSFPNETYAAYVYRHDGTSFVFEEKLANPAGLYSEFGISVAVDDNRVVVGAMGAWQNGTFRAGTAFVYGFDGVDWSNRRRFAASDRQYQDHFGASVAVDGELVLVGNEPAAYPGRVGRAYLFDAHELAVYADPKAAGTGETLTVTAWGGLPGGPLVLAVVALNGGPVYVPLAKGTFSAAGHYTITAPVPPVLSGFTVECRALGLSFLGNLVISNREEIEFL